MHYLKRSMQSSSNLAFESMMLKSSPSARASHSMGAVEEDERIRLAFSH